MVTIMSDAIEAALLPCPFCGGDAELVGPDARTRIFIRCKLCAARSVVVVAAHGGSADESIAAWNRRTAITEAAKGGGVGVKPRDFGGNNVGIADTLDAAKAAAQADYEARIRSALTSPASGVAHATAWENIHNGAIRRVKPDDLENYIALGPVTSPASGERDAVIEDGFIGDDFAEVYRILRDEGTTYAALQAALSNNLNVIIAALARASAVGKS